VDLYKDTHTSFPHDDNRGPRTHLRAVDGGARVGIHRHLHADVAGQDAGEGPEDEGQRGQRAQGAVLAPGDEGVNPHGEDGLEGDAPAVLGAQEGVGTGGDGRVDLFAVAREGRNE